MSFKIPDHHHEFMAKFVNSIGAGGMVNVYNGAEDTYVLTVQVPDILIEEYGEEPLILEILKENRFGKELDS